MMNYLEKKKKAMMNSIQSQPSGYNVSITTYIASNIRYADVTINGNTTTYTMDEVQANPVDCGCLYLTYKAFGGDNYYIISKGTVTYNGVDYNKGTIINQISFSTYNTFEYSGIDEPTPSGVTEFYMPTSARYIVYTDTDYKFGNTTTFSSFTQIGCIEFMYGSGRTTVKAIKDLIYDNTNYSIGDTVLSFGYGGIRNVIFEEV